MAIAHTASVLCFRLAALAALVAATAIPRPAAAAGDSVNTPALKVSELARGVYTIRHPDPTDDFPHGNTTVVIGSRAVLVIDTGYLPSTARADIARIRDWTDRPVRYVVNTHWHNDHVGGNAAYLQAYPGADVIAHRETREMMDLRIRSYVGRFTGGDAQFDAQREERRREAEQGLDAEGKPLDDARRAAARHALERDAAAQREFRTFVYQPPTLTFEHDLELDLGDRRVQLRHLGRGNTGGDIVAWLPEERILVAGDLIDHPVPYAFGGYPGEWLQTLREIERIDARTIVPGHGDVLQGGAYVGRVIALLDSVIGQVNRLVGRRGSGATLELAQKEVDVAAFRAEMAGDDPDNREFFDASIASLVRVVFAEAKAR